MSQQEDRFLREIGEDPQDDSARLVYADWLEERGSRKADYLRLELQLRRARERLDALEQELDPEWTRQVGGPCKLVARPFPAEARHPLTAQVLATGLGIASEEITRLLDSCPTVTIEGLPEEDAEQLRTTLQIVAEVRVTRH
ncbi:MAG: TIGR02996 domain-containing protein [Planctomycetales bacterium]